MIPIGIKGIVRAGRKHVGWNIFVQDDTKITGGYLIIYSYGDEGYDNWVENKEALEAYFEYHGIVVDWEK